MTKQTESKTKVENLSKMPKLRFRAFNKEWEEFKLKDIAKMYDGTHQTPKYVQQGIPFYSVENVTANNFSKTKYIAKDIFEKENKRVKIEQGDILMTRIGDIGTAKYIDWNVQASFYVSLALIKPNKSYSGQYIAHYISTNKFQSELWNRTIHVAFPKKINLGEIGECLINIPCSSEQNQIAACLSLIDERLECQRKIIHELATAIRIIREKIFKQQMRFTREKTQWKELKLDDFTDIKKGEQLNKEDLTEKGIYPCLNGGVNFSGYTDKYNTNANTITISEGGNSCGYINFLTSNFWLGGHCYKIVPKSTIDLIYFYHLLKFNEDKIMKLRVGSGLPNIQQKDLRNFKVSITVSSEEQTKIAKFLSSLDDKIETEKQLLEQYKQQKAYLLQNLFI